MQLTSRLRLRCGHPTFIWQCLSIWIRKVIAVWLPGEKDKASQAFLWGFVREQVEEEATAAGIVDMVKKAGAAGVFFVDAKLGERR